MTIFNKYVILYDDNDNDDHDDGDDDDDNDDDDDDDGDDNDDDGDCRNHPSSEEPWIQRSMTVFH